ncbi:hypothetical protein AC1031_013106 [Aphanomyces cochlioides]|nr:hypothetical protein AC1031_013106 [Aphanomyces cochlioides]
METIDTVQTWKDQLMDYDPTEPRWKEAAMRMREYATAFSQRVKQGGQNGLVDDVRALIPDDVKDELEALPISLFALGLIFYRPFQEYDRVYRHFTTEYSKELSLQARQGKEEFDTTSSVYGEIAFFPFADIIQSVTTELTGGVFYDLGSGVGKAVVAAALVHKFDKAVGIELLKVHYNQRGLSTMLSVAFGRFLACPSGQIVGNQRRCRSDHLVHLRQLL